MLARLWYSDCHSVQEPVSGTHLGLDDEGTFDIGSCYTPKQVCRPCAHEVHPFQVGIS